MGDPGRFVGVGSWCCFGVIGVERGDHSCTWEGILPFP